MLSLITVSVPYIVDAIKSYLDDDKNESKIYALYIVNLADLRFTFNDY
jgi:hypothetical protein